ncbi:hypothetical protein [Propionibacterium freudenreichii]|nr:hypothetical protein [Propionibacterium freudenreichii]
MTLPDTTIKLDPDHHQPMDAAAVGQQLWFNLDNPAPNTPPHQHRHHHHP